MTNDYRCSVPECPEIFQEGSFYAIHFNSAHTIFGPYKCLLCKHGCTYTSVPSSVHKHLKTAHKIHDKLENQFKVVSENPVVFANKSSRFFSSNLRFPISNDLHNFIENPRSFDYAIAAMKTKVNLEISRSAVPPKSNRHPVFYIKIQKAYLKKLQDQNEDFDFKRFLIGLICGYCGECDRDNSSQRQKNHYSSCSVYQTVFIELRHDSNLIGKIVENIVIKLLNIQNLREHGNNKVSGTSYVFDFLSPAEHVQLGLLIVREGHLFFRELFSSPIVLSYDLLSLNSEDVPAPQPESLVEIGNLKITAISKLSASVVANVAGYCKSKIRKTTRRNVLFFYFMLSDGESEIKVHCPREVCDELFDLVAEGEFYLLQKVKPEQYNSSNNVLTMRIVIKESNAIQKSRVSRILILIV